MDATILTIIFSIVSIIATYISYYFSVRAKIQEAAETAIVDAEELDAIGQEKMAVAVEQVYSLVPIGLKPFFTRATIEQIIQYTFDRIEDYVFVQNEKKNQ